MAIPPVIWRGEGLTESRSTSSTSNTSAARRSYILSLNLLQQPARRQRATDCPTGPARSSVKRGCHEVCPTGCYRRPVTGNLIRHRYTPARQAAHRADGNQVVCPANNQRRLADDARSASTAFWRPECRPNGTLDLPGDLDIPREGLRETIAPLPGAFQLLRSGKSSPTRVCPMRKGVLREQPSAHLVVGMNRPHSPAGGRSIQTPSGPVSFFKEAGKARVPGDTR